MRRRLTSHILGTALATALLFACGAREPRSVNPPVTVAGETCPVAPEKAEDCPWAAIARALRAEEAPARGATARLQARLRQLSPAVATAIAAVPSIGGNDLSYVDLWGRSSNYDASQLALATPRPTVDLPILDAVNGMAGMPDARHGGLGAIPDAITFAGIEHTYGYLFSLLSTPFGFKRARWVRDDIEAGFGLPRGTLGPTPKDGTLFANLTYFAGRFAFHDEADARERRALDAVNPRDVAAEVRTFRYEAPEVVRIEETIRLEGGLVVLRTDYVPFTARATAPDGNTTLLVYSVRDSREARARLISAFPVNDASKRTALDPTRMGDALAVTTQFNAFVDGVTNSAQPLLGTRVTRVTRKAR